MARKSTPDRHGKSRQKARPRFALFSAAHGADWSSGLSALKVMLALLTQTTTTQEAKSLSIRWIAEVAGITIGWAGVMIRLLDREEWIERIGARTGRKATATYRILRRGSPPYWKIPQPAIRHIPSKLAAISYGAATHFSEDGGMGEVFPRNKKLAEVYGWKGTKAERRISRGLAGAEKAGLLRRYVKPLPSGPVGRYLGLLLPPLEPRKHTTTGGGNRRPQGEETDDCGGNKHTTTGGQSKKQRIRDLNNDPEQGTRGPSPTAPVAALAASVSTETGEGNSFGGGLRTPPMGRKAGATGNSTPSRTEGAADGLVEGLAMLSALPGWKSRPAADRAAVGRYIDANSIGDLLAWIDLARSAVWISNPAAFVHQQLRDLVPFRGGQAAHEKENYDTLLAESRSETCGACQPEDADQPGRRYETGLPCDCARGVMLKVRLVKGGAAVARAKEEKVWREKEELAFLKRADSDPENPEAFTATLGGAVGTLLPRKRTEEELEAEAARRKQKMIAAFEAHRRKEQEARPAPTPKVAAAPEPKAIQAGAVQRLLQEGHRDLAEDLLALTPAKIDGDRLLFPEPSKGKDRERMAAGRLQANDGDNPDRRIVEQAIRDEAEVRGLHVRAVAWTVASVEFQPPRPGAERPEGEVMKAHPAKESSDGS
ncbi:MAG: hypothetical protein O7H41_08430 [Planctomycetota bacterium]|nr:hypothetical protein [Planctomycetota bacterium]